MNWMPFQCELDPFSIIRTGYTFVKWKKLFFLAKRIFLKTWSFMSFAYGNQLCWMLFHRMFSLTFHFRNCSDTFTIREKFVSQLLLQELMSVKWRLLCTIYILAFIIINIHAKIISCETSKMWTQLLNRAHTSGSQAVVKDDV